MAKKTKRKAVTTGRKKRKAPARTVDVGKATSALNKRIEQLRREIKTLKRAYAKEIRAVRRKKRF